MRKKRSDEALATAGQPKSPAAERRQQGLRLLARMIARGCAAKMPAPEVQNPANPDGAHHDEQG